MKYFLDTNIFLRYFTEEKNKTVYKECESLIKLIKSGKLKAYTSNLVIAEIVWTLQSSYRASKDQIVKTTLLIESLNNLKIEDFFQPSLANQLFKKYSIKYIDSLIASNPNIQSKKMVVVSYDKDFDKLGVERVEPSDLI